MNRASTVDQFDLCHLKAFGARKQGTLAKAQIIYSIDNPEDSIKRTRFKASKIDQGTLVYQHVLNN